MMKSWVWTAALSGLLMLGVAKAETIYENDFQSVELGEEPDEFLVLDGQFVAQEEGTERFLVLPGAPLDNFGALFGPSRREGMRIRVRIMGQSKRRLAPAFGVGLHGLGGFKLMVSANKRKLELLRGDELISSIDYRWQIKDWTQIVFEARPKGESGWLVRGKIWSAAEPEPADWTIQASADTAPPRGKASIWGHPFSGYPIRYDDIVVESVPPLSQD